MMVKMIHTPDRKRCSVNELGALGLRIASFKDVHNRLDHVVVCVPGPSPVRSKTRQACSCGDLTTSLKLSMLCKMYLSMASADCVKGLCSRTLTTQTTRPSFSIPFT